MQSHRSKRHECLYFVTRRDLPEGYRAAQLIHAANAWAGFFDPHDETVIVYEVPDEEALEEIRERVSRANGEVSYWCEPDLGFQLTALATSTGPLDLPLLGKGRKPRGFRKSA